ncbi:MAG: tRNA lysidine(34) synthetase TilS [Boseongicola sp. SB0677_bin_26]|nr:tRNA lysidine(34) synthetase TilS [Boseongicola sp. SB0665_bin_10]MYG28679.1 tRNA lysidine(34) synthetase TilS [Boseongicola sp. SB0677_bin_26]
MACLEVMLWHGCDLGFPVEAVTVDHGLRPEASGEIGTVADHCAEKGIPHTVLTWKWSGAGNLQAEARRARYRLIGDWARNSGIDQVALGHTRDDVAETFIMRLARRSGVDGLSEMDHRFTRHGTTWIRPMLDHGREEWREYLLRRDISWIEDPSNDDPKFERVRARDRLKALSKLGIDAGALSEVARNMSAAREALEHYVRREAARIASEENGDVILAADASSQGRRVPREILFRLRRHALAWVGGGAYPPRSDAMLELDHALRNEGRHTLAGCIITREPDGRDGPGPWRIAREFNAVKDVFGRTDRQWDGRWVLEGPHADALEVRALGEAVRDTPWRETGMPRRSLLASPAIWRGATLVAAPVAGLAGPWTAKATGRGRFDEFLQSR